MGNNSIHWTDSDEYKKISDKVFKVMLSCETVEHWESCKKYNELAVSYCYERRQTQDDVIFILSMGSFRRGFISGMIQALREEIRIKGVHDYLSLGC